MDNNYNRYDEYNQYDKYKQYDQYGRPPKKDNTALIIAVSVLAGVLVIGFVTVILMLSGLIRIGNTQTETAAPAVTAAPVQTDIPSAANAAVPAATPYIPENTTVSKYMYVSNVKYSIYFRSAPSENDSNIICEIPLGTLVGFIEVSDGTFSKIAYNGQIGYVKTKYLSDNEPYVSSNETVQSYKYIANVKYAVYLRSQPEENDDNIICEIALGQEVGYIEKANSVFSKVKYDGQIGYVKSEYLSSSKSASSDKAKTGGSTMTVVNVAYAIYLRSSPDESSDSNIIMEIPVGATVNYLGTPNGTFYKISYGGTVGYSKQAYLAFD